MGALPESQVKSFIERLVGPLGPGATEELLKQADAKAAGGDAVGASDLYSGVLAQDPDKHGGDRRARQAACRHG